MINSPLITNLKGLITQLEQAAVFIGLAIAGLVMVILVITIMFKGETSATRHESNWKTLIHVFVCAVVIGGIGSALLLAQSFSTFLTQGHF